jgi:hypothetical protein
MPDVAAKIDAAAGTPAAGYRAVAGRTPSGPAYGRNPLVEALARENPAVYQLASAEGPPPTLFPTGDLPPFTASGLDPQFLLSLPWQARHPVARAPSLAEAYELVDQLAGEDGELEAALRFAATADNTAYESRVWRWARGGSAPGPTREPQLAFERIRHNGRLYSVYDLVRRQGFTPAQAREALVVRRKLPRRAAPPADS